MSFSLNLIIILFITCAFALSATIIVYTFWKRRRNDLTDRNIKASKHIVKDTIRKVVKNAIKVTASPITTHLDHITKNNTTIAANSAPMKRLFETVGIEDKPSGFVQLSINRGITFADMDDERSECLSHQGTFSEGKEIFEWKKCNPLDRRQIFRVSFLNGGDVDIRLTGLMKNIVTSNSPVLLQSMINGKCITTPSKMTSISITSKECDKFTRMTPLFYLHDENIFRYRQSTGSKDCIIKGTIKYPFMFRPGLCTDDDKYHVIARNISSKDAMIALTKDMLPDGIAQHIL